MSPKTQIGEFDLAILAHAFGRRYNLVSHHLAILLVSFGSSFFGVRTVMSMLGIPWLSMNVLRTAATIGEELGRRGTS
jgi:hypothetical protein